MKTKLFTFLFVAILLPVLSHAQYDNPSDIYSVVNDSLNLSGKYYINDINNDGHGDLVTQRRNSSNTYATYDYAASNSDCQFTTLSQLFDIAHPEKMSSYFLEDINGDGIEDVLYPYNTLLGGNPSKYAYGFNWLAGNGDGTFNTTNHVKQLDNGHIMNINKVADFNNNGHNDLLIYFLDTLSNLNIVILENNGSGVFNSLKVVASNLSFNLNYSLAAGDFDNDNDLDVVYTQTESFIGFLANTYRNNGNNNFGPAVTTILFSTGTISTDCKVEVADLNGNGKDDLFFTTSSYSIIDITHFEYEYYYQYFIYTYNNLTGLLVPKNTFNTWPHEYKDDFNFDLVYDDVNDDGKIDILTYHPSQSKLFWFIGNGNGDFFSEEVVSSNYVPSGKPRLRANDFDEDGDMDVFSMTITSSTDKVELFKNQTVSFTDIDGDGVNSDVDCDDNNAAVGDTLYAPMLPSTASVCEGDNYQFDIANVVPGVSYLWTATNGFSSNVAEPSLPSVSSQDEATYTVAAYTDLCTSPTSTQFLDVLAAPIVTIQKQGNLLVASGNTFGFYQWYLDGQPINGENGSTYMPITSGDYTVTLISKNGCKSESNTNTITISGLTDNALANGISLYPNPARTNSHLNLRFNSSINLPATIIVSNTAGQVVSELTMKTLQTALSLDHLSAGAYTIQITTANQSAVKRFVILE